MTLWRKKRARSTSRAEPPAPGFLARFPAGWDAESPGSRYTMRPAIAVLSRPDGASRFDQGEDPGDGHQVAHEILADADPDAVEALGEFAVIDGSHGRGAANWVPVIEWLGLTVAGGVTWEVVTLASRRFARLVKSLRDRHIKASVSRGGAALVAMGHVLIEIGDEGILDVEAVDEPAAWRGQPAHELNYTDTDPWMVSLLNEQRTRRYIVAVASSGEVLDRMALPITETERFYLPGPSAQ